MIYLLFCALALLVYVRMAIDVERAEQLDISDSIIEAAFQKDDRDEQERLKWQMREALEVVRERAAKEPEYIEELKGDTPDLFNVLAELDIDLGSTNKAS